MLTRRSFLIGSSAALAVAAVGLPAAANVSPSQTLAKVAPHDDAAFIQALIDEAAATGAPAMIPTRTYSITRTLVIPDNVALFGQGSTLSGEVKDGPVVRIIGNNVYIDRINIQANGGYGFAITQPYPKPPPI